MCSCTYVRGGEWCGRVRETTYLLSEHTKPYVKAQLVGLLLGLVDTLKVIIMFCLKVGKTTLKKSCTRTKAWKGGCGHKEGLFNNYLKDHSFGLGNLGHILLSTSQRLKGN